MSGPDRDVGLTELRSKLQNDAASLEGDLASVEESSIAEAEALESLAAATQEESNEQPDQ